MAENFMPSWINCIDESMSVWFSEYTCPGWMSVPRKPHPFGNEYQTACCGKSGILWALELVEGKDRPRQLDKPDFDNLGKTVGLLLCLTSRDSGRGHFRLGTVRSLLYRIPLRYSIRYPVQKGLATSILDTMFGTQYTYAAYVGQ
jgi:hypothetical protein